MTVCSHFATYDSSSQTQEKLDGFPKRRPTRLRNPFNHETGWRPETMKSPWSGRGNPGWRSHLHGLAGERRLTASTLGLPPGRSAEGRDERHNCNFAYENNYRVFQLSNPHNHRSSVGCPPFLHPGICLGWRWISSFGSKPGQPERPREISAPASIVAWRRAKPAKPCPARRRPATHYYCLHPPRRRQSLDPDNRVSLLAKFIDTAAGESRVRIRNRYDA